MSQLTKPEKVYLENTNLMHALTTHVEEGNDRETFFANQLKEGHQVTYSGKGDFLIDGKYTFEIGWRSKDFSQIAGIENSFVFADDWDMPDGAKLPLWMLGFLY